MRGLSLRAWRATSNSLAYAALAIRVARGTAVSMVEHRRLFARVAVTIDAPIIFKAASVVGRPRGDVSMHRDFVTIRCRDAAMLQELLSFNDGFLQRIARVSEADAQERFDACPEAFHCVIDERGAIHGYFILLPLSAGCVARLRAGDITSSREIRTRDLASHDAPSGLYLSVVCANGWFARTAIIGACFDRVAMLYRTTAVQSFFVRAATKEGAHMLTHLSNETFHADGVIHEVNLSTCDAAFHGQVG